MEDLRRSDSNKNDKKKKIKMNKSILLGISILDISKTVMYEHYYEHIRPQQKTSITTEQYYVMLFYVKIM